MMPFPGGIEGTANGILILSIAAALLYLLVISRPPSPRRTIVKAGSTALLATLAFEAGGPLLLVVALALSALGDAALAQDKRRLFFAGLASFLLAHIAYLVLFLRAGAGMEAFTAAPWLVVIVLAVIAFAGGMLMLLWHRADAGLRLPIAAYTVALLAMVFSALTVPSPLLIVGALLFMASDALLAWRKFLTDAAHHRSSAAIAGWVAYYAAQLTIALAILT